MGHQRPPGLQRGPAEVVATPGRGRADLRPRSEQHHDVTGAEVGGDTVGVVTHRLEVEHRVAPLPGQVHRGDQPADRRPAGPATARPPGVGEQGDPRQPALLGRQVAERPAARRGPPSRPPGRSPETTSRAGGRPGPRRAPGGSPRTGRPWRTSPRRRSRRGRSARGCPSPARRPARRGRAGARRRTAGSSRRRRAGGRRGRTRTLLHDRRSRPLTPRGYRTGVRSTIPGSASRTDLFNLYRLCVL